MGDHTDAPPRRRAGDRRGRQARGRSLARRELRGALPRRGLLLTLALALAACGSTTTDAIPPPSPAASPAPPLTDKVVRDGHTDRVYRARLNVVVEGARALGPEQVEVELRIVEIFGGKNPREIWFYSVSPNVPVELPDGRLMLFSADLSPGIWNGPGTYELSEEAGVNLGGTAGVSSGAYVQIYSRGDDAEQQFARFDVFGEACRLTAAPEDRTGSVDCPSLLDRDGNEVELHWNWARL